MSLTPSHNETPDHTANTLLAALSPRVIIAAKTRAGVLHMLASVIIFSSFAALAALLWFPKGLFMADGGFSGLKIMLMIDVVLGPVLTMVVFNPLKPRSELVRDIGFIVICQLSALAFGMYTVFQQHPVALIYTGKAFESLTYKDAKQVNFSQAQLKQLDPNNIIPVIYGAPKDAAEEIADFTAALNGSKLGPAMHPERYHAWPPHQAEIAATATADLKKIDPAAHWINFTGRDQSLWLRFDAQGTWLDSRVQP